MSFCWLSIKHFMQIANFLVVFEAEIRATGAKEAPQLIQVASFQQHNLWLFKVHPCRTTPLRASGDCRFCFANSLVLFAELCFIFMIQSQDECCDLEGSISCHLPKHFSRGKCKQCNPVNPVIGSCHLWTLHIFVTQLGRESFSSTSWMRKRALVPCVIVFRWHVALLEHSSHSIHLLVPCGMG